MNYQNQLQQLICGSKGYAWGIPGSDPQCLVYKYASKSHQNYSLTEQIDPEKPYAELWMGIHPSLSSKFLSTNKPLSEDNSINIPFLFKVLSVNTALSIQAHPNKQQAIILNQNDTKNYPDNNHKPEMAISLGVFEALSGIAPKERIIENFEKNKRLIECLGQEQWNQFKQDQNADIKQIIMKILNFHDDQLKYIIQCLELPLNSPCKSIYELQSQYPNDVGLIFVLLLNHIKLDLGEALIMGAGQLHAYLKGNCLECMANSDNVVRAGFTEKFKDKFTLCDIMVSEMCDTQKVKPEVKQFQSYSISRYLTPFKEFQCIKIQIESKIEEQQISIERQSILICTEGKMIVKVNDQIQTISIGDCYLIRENSQLLYYSDEESVIYICTSQ